MIRFLLVSFLTVLLSFWANGQVLYGSQIDYKQLDTFKYEVRLKVYADCRDSAFVLDTNTSYFYVHPNKRADKKALSPTLISTESISPFADSITVCSYSTAWFKIIEYTYLDTVDFNTTFNSFKNDTLIFFEFSTERMAIADNITTSGTYRQSRNFSELFLHKKVKGGYFTSEPMFQAGVNFMLVDNHLLNVNNGQDSLIYGFYPPYTFSGNVIFTGTYLNYNHPWPVYYPGSLGPPYTNPNANPPIGIYFNKHTSDIISTPITNGNYDYGVEVIIYNKDSSGNRQVAGKMRRDLMLLVRTIPDNNPPIINGPYAYNVCEGSQLCFNITTSDPVFVPPPPATAPAPDTTFLEWDGALAEHGATFTILNDSARLKIGQFCWTPSIGTPTDIPYYFTARAKDNSGSVFSKTRRTFGIKVKQAAKATVEFDSVVCGTKLIGIERKVVPDSNFAGSPTTNTQLLDSSGKVLVSERLFFNSSNTFLSTRFNDTLIGDTSGVFILKTVINNTPNNCPRASYDTISIALSYPEGAHLPTETVICDQPSDTLKIIGNWASIVWNTGDTTANLVVDSAAIYTAYATDTCGNRIRFSTQVYIETSPKYQFADTFKCLSDTLKFIYLDTEPHSIFWSDSTKLDSFRTRDTGLFWVRIDKRCGSITDSFEIKNNFPRAEVLTDSSVCGEITFSFNQLNPGSNQFVWTQNAVKKYDSSLVSKQIEQVNLHLANRCGTNQYYHIMAMPVQPHISINQDSVLLCPNTTINISATGNYLGNWRWNTGDTTANLTVNKAGVYSIENKVHCGTAKDSILVIANVKPNVSILADSSVCDTIKYTANLIEGYENTVSWVQNSITLNDNTLYSTKEEFIQLKVVNECGQKIVNSFLKPIEAPVISILHGNPILCGGDSVKVRATGNYRENWVWDDGNKDTIRYFAQAGNYSVSNAVYCGTATDTILVISQNPPNAVLFADTFLCPGDTLYLASLVSDSSSTKRWNTGSRADTLSVISGGNYWLKLTNECGVSTDTINIAEKQMPKVNLGSDKFADLPFSIELKADSADTYLWSTGSIAKSIQVTDTGCYWVQVGNVCGTASDTICIADTLSGTGLAILQKLGVEVYPNPASDILTIKSSSLPIQSVALVDLAGRQIVKYDVNQPNFHLGVTEIATGTYFLKLGVENKTYWSKVLIDRR